jgi:putative phosphoribosyl transferase
MTQPSPVPFIDRIAAGQQLALRLESYAHSSEVCVLGLPRGGIPVAYEIARTLGVALDAFLVRKLGVPAQPELAMGAIASGGSCYLNARMIASCHVSNDALETVIQKEQQELKRREHLYRQNRPPLPIEYQQIILVDDGIATGASMQVALMALRDHNPKRLIVAIPVAPRSSLRQFSAIADEVICLLSPTSFNSVGQWYLNFAQVSDAEVCELLSQPTQGF